MEQKNKQKRYYKKGETVFVKMEKVLAEIKELNVKPNDGIYEAVLEVLEGEQKGSILKVSLWEIDKNRQGSSKAKKPTEKKTKKPTILFAKVKPDAIIPSREDENAGYDIYANFEDDYIRFAPHETKLVPTGIASSLIKDYALIAKERGSTGTKGLGLRAGVVDSGYRGEIFIALTNENNKELLIAKSHVVVPDELMFVVYPYTKAIAQLILVPVINANVKEIPYDQLKAIPSKRGAGNIGSSGK